MLAGAEETEKSVWVRRHGEAAGRGGEAGMGACDLGCPMTSHVTCQMTSHVTCHMTSHVTWTTGRHAGSDEEQSEGASAERIPLCLPLPDCQTARPEVPMPPSAAIEAGACFGTRERFVTQETGV
eukprot:1130647-Rhodomonas_salina.1